ncbi:MAG TPA: alpha/beta hydrolase family protein [Pirellulales bacterium]|nr:alpha/beta hydrolase family protein [Pirellulales bacterium]
MKRRRYWTIGLVVAATLAWTIADGAPPIATNPDSTQTAATQAVSANSTPAHSTEAAPPVRHGEIQFSPSPNEATAVPEPFRLEAKKFPFELTPQPSVSDAVSVSLLTFPSPVHTDHVANNTVHCEYYRPAAPGRYPACIVLHILGGDFPLSRTFANALAHRGVAALFVIMPYYGPRHDPNSSVRMVSSDPKQTVRGMTQAVKDIRVATAWLGQQSEIDPRQLGVFGISLGGITAALAGEAEPRFEKICPVLAGGGIGAILWDSTEPHVAAARKYWEAAGGSRQSLQDLMAKVDPATYADRARGRKILMLNASHDELIPRKCTDLLWKGFGQPRIVWYDCGHYSALWHLVDAVQQVTDFFQPNGK